MGMTERGWQLACTRRRHLPNLGNSFRSDMMSVANDNGEIPASAECFGEPVINYSREHELVLLIKPHRSLSAS